VTHLYDSFLLNIFDDTFLPSGHANINGGFGGSGGGGSSSGGGGGGGGGFNSPSVGALLGGGRGRYKEDGIDGKPG